MKKAARTPLVQSRAGRWGLAALGCALVLGTGAGSAARAQDRIEDNLPAQAYKVVKYLKKQGCRNVGVLKFRVKKGSQPESFRVGPLNVAMTTRMENALLLMNDKSSPLGIIHEAGHVAAGKKEKATYLTPQGCAKLFGYKYPLAWGSQWVEADAFVTGVVRINPAKRTTTVTIEAIDRKTKRLTPVTSYEVRTDRTILTDVCTNFVLGKRQIRTMSLDDQNKAANDQALGKGGTNKKNLAEYLDFEILYGTAVQEQKSRDEENLYVEGEPKEGTEIVLRLTSKSDKRLAVVVGVNGRSTLYEEDLRGQDYVKASKWVLEPRKAYQLKGFYHKGDTSYSPFKVLPEEESKKMEELETDNKELGAFTLVVYEEGDGPADPLAKTQSMGLRKALPLNKGRPRTAREAANLVGSLKGSSKGMGLIKSDETSKQTELKTVEFKNPTLVASRWVWYYTRKAGSPGSGNPGTGDPGTGNPGGGNE